MGALAGLEALLPAYAGCAAGAVGGRPDGAPGSQPLRPRTVDGAALVELEVAESPIVIAGRRASAITINGTVPGPLLELQEGQETVLRVTNRLAEDTSIHWHGVLVPEVMDGVPGVSFPGIVAGTTFEYRFVLRQYGTYWYHSHSGLQEQLGHYGPLVIHPAGGYPYAFDRVHTIVLSDWTFENPHTVLAKLKNQGNYYNWQRLTLGDFFADAAENGLGATIADRFMWARMRMDPTDLLDVTGATYTYLVNGLAPEGNWTGLFTPGERVLLRIINASAATYFDVRIPGLPLSVVQSNGQFVQPVATDELRIAVAETYDVVVQPPDDRAYAFFAETMDRSGFARGTLAPRAGMSAPVPARRPRPRLTMADMGMAHGEMDMDMGGMDMGGGHSAGHAAPPPPADAGTDMGGGHGGHGGGRADAGTDQGAGHGGHAGGADAGTDAEHRGHAGMAGAGPMRGDAEEVAVAGAIRTQGLRPPGTIPGMARHEPDTHGPGNSAVPDMVRSRLHEPGIGLGKDGWRVLTYADLRSLHPEPRRPPDREIEMHLTGNMERFMWTIDGVPFRESELVHFRFGERIRLTMVNDSMMNHPMHLHGMWMELENGHGESIPRVHTINVQPAERISLLITADAPGMWAFHCHILYHMEAGMFRVVKVSEAPAAGQGHEGTDPHGH